MVRIVNFVSQCQTHTYTRAKNGGLKPTEMQHSKRDYLQIHWMYN